MEYIMPFAKNTFMVLDTETCDLAGNVYDVGYTITDRKGNIEKEYTALVAEIFTDADKMMGAFYAKKLFSHYAPMLDRGEISLVPWAEIVGRIRADVLAHGINVLCAYNLAFDKRVMANTNKLLGDGPIFQAPVKLLDIWRFACETKLNTRLYKDLARQMGWVSNAGNLRTGAEYAYRFCRGDWGFIEDHTALSDARIETAILADCFATKKRIPYNNIADKYAHAPWRIVNQKEVS
jgi:hypothetical protein